mmetsp:Transcript_44010/g.127284  ORF Transcript_44010/g.127284 Transcript_44010/m.127284 type:complete len:257 (+) Transcript_44010:1546-2316(+)
MQPQQGWSPLPASAAVVPQPPMRLHELPWLLEVQMRIWPRRQQQCRQWAVLRAAARLPPAHQPLALVDCHHRVAFHPTFQPSHDLRAPPHRHRTVRCRPVVCRSPQALLPHHNPQPPSQKLFVLWPLLHLLHPRLEQAGRLGAGPLHLCCPQCQRQLCCCMRPQLPLSRPRTAAQGANWHQRHRPMPLPIALGVPPWALPLQPVQAQRRRGDPRPALTRRAAQAAHNGVSGGAALGHVRRQWQQCHQRPASPHAPG